MKQYKPTTPMHYYEGLTSEWQRWFAWRPVKLEQGGWCWLRRTWRRRFTPPLWFVPPAPFDGWIEHSDEQLGYWEERAPDAQ